MKPDQIWMPGAEFHPLTHLFQANFCPQDERHRAAVSLQPVGWKMVFLIRASLRWSPAFWQQAQSRLDSFFIQMSEYLVDHHRIFNAGDYFNRATTFTAVFNVDVKYALQSLCPLVRMSRCREAHGCARTARSLRR